jgi:hypothetical protein
MYNEGNIVVFDTMPLSFSPSVIPMFRLKGTGWPVEITMG